MADYSLVEQKVLKELGISDFKHVTKDNIVMLRTALDKYNPEVAKAIIAQIPEELKVESECISVLGKYASETLENDKQTSTEINEQNSKIIDGLTTKLNDSDSSEEIQSKTIDALVHISDNNTAIEHAKIESRNVTFDAIKKIGIGILAFLGFAGGAYIISKNSTPDEINQNDDVIN